MRSVRQGYHPRWEELRRHFGNELCWILLLSRQDARGQEEGRAPLEGQYMGFDATEIKPKVSWLLCFFYFIASDIKLSLCLQERGPGLGVRKLTILAEASHVRLSYCILVSNPYFHLLWEWRAVVSIFASRQRRQLTLGGVFITVACVPKFLLSLHLGGGGTDSGVWEKLNLQVLAKCSHVWGEILNCSGNGRLDHLVQLFGQENQVLIRWVWSSAAWGL